MTPSRIKIILVVWVAVNVHTAKSQTEPSIASNTTGENERCVCPPHDTTSPPERPCSQDTVASELLQIKQQLETLRSAVTSMMDMLKDTLVIYPKDCSEALTRGVTESGVYTVQPLDLGRPFKVYCDMETDGGGWTVFQRRQDGSVDFYLNFANYSRGFGDLDGEFWLGNEFLHRLTAEGLHELRIDLADFENNTRHAKYVLFRVSDASDVYRLTVKGYSGTAGDSMYIHNNRQFTTLDLDNDGYSKNCADRSRGAWWYATCLTSNLNGAYLRGPNNRNGRGIVWSFWKGYYYSLKTSEMKLRTAP